MPAFNFQERFAAYVAYGLKKQTIRPKRKNRPRVGQTAHCFTAMRTRQCRRLGSWSIVSVRDIRIFDEGVLLDGGAVRCHDLDALAMADGFQSWPEMVTWFRSTHGLPFHGDLVKWSYA